MSHHLVALITLLLVSTVIACAGTPRNLFHELLGKTEAETTARVEGSWRQFTQGDAANERLYFEAADDTAYIADVGNGDVRSEGMSYGLMIAVQLDRQDEFKRLWKWAYTHMRHAAGPRRGYFSWQCGFDGRDLGGGVSASDGEEWIVTALFFAAHRWGDGEGIFAYSREAQTLLREMLHKPTVGEYTAIFDREHRQVVFCPIGKAATMTDPSYHLPHFYALWARWAEDAEDRAFWAAAALESRAFFRRNAHTKTGLMSEYANFDGTPFTDLRHGAGKDEFGFDAWRTLAHVALDHAWGSGDAWQVGQSDRVLHFLGAQGDALVNRYTRDGRPLTDYSSPGLVAMAAAAGVAASPDLTRPFVQGLWDAPLPTGKWRYYDGLLTVLGLLQTSGRFRVFDAPVKIDAPAASSVASASLSAPMPTQPVSDVVEAVRFDSFRYAGHDELAARPLPSGHYRNPILAGFFPDPSVCRVGDDYYLVNSTFGYFPGLPIFHSRDLVNWALVGHAIDRPAQLDYRGVAVSRGLFAPAITHHAGRFYIVCTMIDGGGNFVLTATDPAGPWSDPTWLDFGGIDPSLFFDDDGRAWLVHNGGPPDDRALYDGHRAIWLREFDPVALRVLGEPRLLVNGGVDLAARPVWIEGPHLFKRDGGYYLTCAEGGTGEQHSQVILRGRAVTGPFEPWRGNPILTQRDLDGSAPGAVTCIGHADLIEGPGGRWWAVFLGCRPFARSGGFTAGRETFLLPVRWTEDGWPVILSPGKRVPLIAPGPELVANARTPLNGNFTWSDDFTRAPLDPLWLELRAPLASWWRLDAAVGKLLVTPLAAPLSGLGQPALLARRVQHARFNASVTLDPPATPGVSAGLALFQSETHHYFCAVRRESEGLVLIVELADGAGPTVIARRALPSSPTSITLRVEADDERLGFACATDGGTWLAIGENLSTRPVTVQVAGGVHFTGAVVGLHVRLEPHGAP